MITVEQGQEAVNNVAVRVHLPIDIKLGLKFGTYAPPGEQPMPMIQVRMELDFDPILAFGFNLKNTFDLETFEVWLLGFVNGVMQFADAMDNATAAEEMADNNMRLH